MPARVAAGARLHLYQRGSGAVFDAVMRQATLQDISVSERRWVQLLAGTTDFEVARRRLPWAPSTGIIVPGQHGRMHRA